MLLELSTENIAHLNEIVFYLNVISSSRKSRQTGMTWQINFFLQASTRGNYTFILTGNVEAEILVTRSRYSTTNIMRLLIEKEKSRQASC